MFDLQGLNPPNWTGSSSGETLSLQSIMRAAEMFNKFNDDV
jgi:hypothetical protein